MIQYLHGEIHGFQKISEYAGRKIHSILFLYRIDGKGFLYHDGTLQDDAKFLDFFFKRLKPNDTGENPDYPYISPCGKEMNFIRSEGAPFVFRKLNDQRKVLIFAASLEFNWRPEQLVFGSDGQLYHPAPFELGRISPELLLEWQNYLDFDSSWKIRPEGPFASLSKTQTLSPMEEDLDNRMRLPEHFPA